MDDRHEMRTDPQVNESGHGGAALDPGLDAALDASLRRLGIRELEQRMEVAPLLSDQPLVPVPQDFDMPCCVCKLNDPTQLDENGMLPYPSMVK